MEKIIKKPRVAYAVNTEIEIRCTACGELWPSTTEYFYSNGAYSDGTKRLHSWCKDCYINNPKMIAKRARWDLSQKLKRAAEKQGATA